MDKYYIAYGSNLNLKEMSTRCPRAEMVGKGLLRGYRLAFRYYATIEKDESESIEVGVFRITDDDEKMLDYYESYPTLYDKEYVDVEIKDKVVKALVYVMKQDSIGYTIPEQTYLIRCLKGYTNFHMNIIQISDAVYNTVQEMFEEVSHEW